MDDDDIDDLDDAPGDEMEKTEEELLGLATAASTINELKAEIATLKKLGDSALEVRRGGLDTKWQELANLFTDRFASDQKLVIIYGTPGYAPVSGKPYCGIVGKRRRR